MQIYKFRFYIYKRVCILLKIYIFSFTLPHPSKTKDNLKHYRKLKHHKLKVGIKKDGASPTLFNDYLMFVYCMFSLFILLFVFDDYYLFTGKSLFNQRVNVKVRFFVKHTFHFWFDNRIFWKENCAAIFIWQN